MISTRSMLLRDGGIYLGPLKIGAIDVEASEEFEHIIKKLVI